MVRERMKKLIAVTMVVSTIFSGCGASIASSSAGNVNLTPALTKQELLDYYAESLNYDTIVSRAAEVHLHHYNTSDVTDESCKMAVESFLNTTEGLMALPEYTATEKSNVYLTESMYNFIKAMLNDKAISRKEIVSIKQALGCYFVDVKYNVTPAEIGTFKSAVSLVGIDGALHYIEAGDYDQVNEYHMDLIKEKLDEYYSSNKMEYGAYFDKDTVSFRPKVTNKELEELESDSDVDDYGFGFDDDYLSEFDDMTDGALAGMGEDGDAIQGNIDNSEIEMQSPEIQDEGLEGYDEIPESSDEYGLEDGYDFEEEEKDVEPGQYEGRAPAVDVNWLHKIVGHGVYSAYVPKLSMIYNIPGVATEDEEESDEFEGMEEEELGDAEEEGEKEVDITESLEYMAGDAISGIGLYPCGQNGLQDYEFVGSIDGTMTLRFIMKQSLNDPREMELENIYVVEYKNNKVEANTKDDGKEEPKNKPVVIVPDFLMQEYDSLVDRTDRAIANCDIAGLISGHIYDDIGQAILVGYHANYGNLLRQVSCIREVKHRSPGDDTAVIEVETIRKEGAKSSDLYAGYKDTIYMLIVKNGSEFIVKDWQMVSRELIEEPDISPDAATAKRIATIGIGTGDDISDETKKAVQGLINELYVASTNRVLYVDQSTVNEDTVIKRGMYDCFNSNNQMLSSTKREKINSDLRTDLIKYGTSNGAEVKGVVTEWLGGADNQVEVITEELVIYQNRGVALYRTCYYLTSNIEDIWVIDDLKVLDSREVSGDELSKIESRLK